MGRLNFLMNNFDNDKKIITELKNDRLKYDVCKSRSLAVFINDIFVGQAVNEVILGDSVMSYNEFTIRTETGELDGLDFRGGGICISTPIGSTAFNFNNNGSILPLHSELLSVTGLMADRYINDIVSLQEIKIETGKVKLFLDGIDRGMIKNGEVVAIIPGEEIDLVFLDKKHFLNRRIEFSNRLRKV
jgi:NAD kinase